MYVKPGEVEEEGIGLMDGRLVELRFSDDDASTGCASATWSTWRASTAGSAA